MTTKHELLASISFGQRVAEEEGDELTKYFVETDHWRRLFSGQVDIAYGSKGSGKSALYALILARREELFSRSILLAAAENPRGAPAFRDLVSDPPATEREFIGLWKLYFAILVADVFEEYGISDAGAVKLRDALEREGLVRKGRTLRSLLRSALDYVHAAFHPRAVEAGLDLDPLTGVPKGFRGRIIFQEPGSSSGLAGYHGVDELLSAANDALGAQGVSLWILLDRLDVAFAENPHLEQNALRALFRVYLDLMTYHRLRLKVFLRTDIWRRITNIGFPEASHITCPFGRRAQFDAEPALRAGRSRGPDSGQPRVAGASSASVAR